MVYFYYKLIELGFNLYFSPKAFNRRLSFIAEWYQEEAAIIRTFTICFFPTGNAIEVVSLSIGIN